jgi:hypothetical protein
MKIAASIVKDLSTILQEEVRAGEIAVTRAIKAETERLKTELRQQVTAAFGDRSRGIANAWRSRVFPQTGESLRAAGIVWTKVPNIVDAFERGVTIRARNGKYLAIPTGFNRQGGRRGAKPRVTPQQMVDSKQAFVRPFKNGRGLVWCLPVRRGERIGRRRAPLIAGGIAAVATGRRKGAAAWQQSLLAQGFVPMFLLLPEVRLAKRLDVRKAGNEALARLPSTIVREWRTEERNGP